MSRIKHSAAAPLVTRLLLLASLPTTVFAHPYPLQNVANNLFYELGDKFMRRDCVQRCGVDSQYCCGSGEQCYTVNNIAGCSTINGGGGYGIYTTTWTETNTFTSTITTNWPETTKGSGGGAGGGAGVPCKPKNAGESACGSICCASDQYCAYEGQCAQKGWVPTTISSNGVPITTQFSPPYRVTTTTTRPTGTAASATSTGTAVPVDEGTGGGLSGGAIAGIVIGTLAGLGLLMLLCFCCIARGLWGLIFGGKKKKERSRERVEVVEERYSRHGSRMPSAHSHRPSHGGWFGGGRPASAAHRKEEKKEGAKWLGLGAAAATLLALLNLKKDKPPRKPRTTYTDSYYSYTGTSPSAVLALEEEPTERAIRVAPTPHVTHEGSAQSSSPIFRPHMISIASSIRLLKPRICFERT
ncbi:uncharacterized protein CTRU02_208805 [Colletotrichum truncatum]|uniref:Uncharacterized protein n=1 Tax=Colletotrichum truncatum TaxID=5467 RepID=A0ACC3YXE0_COLTU|nr:uncharacterized protein CTRU02_06537 [Colletotrichum truncatum]KAF6792454.1 hypothetical protein CTRU02_06537 [Colletotrichum truncatum]